MQRGTVLVARMTSQTFQVRVLAGSGPVAIPDFSPGQPQSEVTLTQPKDRVPTTDTIDVRCFCDLELIAWLILCVIGISDSTGPLTSRIWRDEEL